MFCFSCKAYEDFRKDVSLFDTAAVADVSHVMSAHDVRTVWDFVNFIFIFTKVCKVETIL